mgnify:CR=1 FL=1
MEKLIAIDVEIEGVTPLLMNQFTDEAAAKATSRQSSAITGDQGSTEDQAKSKIYMNEEQLDPSMCVNGQAVLRTAERRGLVCGLAACSQPVNWRAILVLQASVI